MPATERRTKGKTAFVRGVLSRNPYANAKRVREEWEAAGNSGSISQTLVNKQRSELGLSGNLKGGRPRRPELGSTPKPPYTGKKRGRKPKSASQGAHDAAGNGRPFDEPKTRTGGWPAQLSQIEAEIDRLLFRVMNLGGLENIEDSLRRTRRMLYQAVPGARS